MPSVSIHPPKTPVTKGSNTVAAATLPNVCKMPGPPAPFVPTPLPNIGRSALSPKGYSTTVKIEGNFVAIMGASFNSMGDIASKATGGGILSNNTHGPTKFIAPGSLTVKIQGKNVHLLSDVMSNNNGPAGSPPNSATLMGAMHAPLPGTDLDVACAIQCCDKKPYNLPNNRGGRKTCQRLAHRKHSCVLHRLREKKGNKLTTENKFPNIQASRRYPPSETGASRVLIPDVVMNGNRVIDAKFPCDPANVKFGKNVVNPSLDLPGKATKKEKRDYKLIPGIKEVKPMSPKQAREKGECAC
jgi:hypothetical protein